MKEKSERKSGRNAERERERAAKGWNTFQLRHVPNFPSSVFHACRVKESRGCKLALDGEAFSFTETTRKDSPSSRVFYLR